MPHLPLPGWAGCRPGTGMGVGEAVPARRVCTTSMWINACEVDQVASNEHANDWTSETDQGRVERAVDRNLFVLRRDRRAGRWLTVAR